ncbi:unnamed protein product, partial [Rotaria sordida]
MQEKQHKTINRQQEKGMGVWVWV